jgi:hypothetical protein
MYLMIYLWLWIVPFPQSSNNMELLNYLTQPFDPMQTDNDIYTGENELLDSIIDSIMNTEERPEFLNLVRQAESGGKYRPEKGVTDFPYGNPEALAETTTAAGVYQFTKDSVDTAKNRAKNIGFDSSFIDLIPNDPTQWTNDEADIMFLANMFASTVDPNNPKAKKGKMYSGLEGESGLIDSLLSLVLNENPDSNIMRDLYYTLHHTNPDQATINRAQDIFGVERGTGENPVLIAK